MARKRMIAPEIWTDKKIIKLSNNELLLFIGIFSNADDEGIIERDFQSIYFKLARSEYTIESIENYYKKLEALKLIVSYDNYSFLPNWYKYQVINHPVQTKLKRPPKKILEDHSDYIADWQNTFKTAGKPTLYPFETCLHDSCMSTVDIQDDYGSTTVAMTRRLDQINIDQINNIYGDLQNDKIDKNENLPVKADCEQTESNQKSLTTEKDPPVSVNLIKSQFQEWYNEYPRKLGKQAAFNYFRQIIQNKEATFETLKKATANYKKYINDKKMESQYVCYASTFLGTKKRYQDFLQDKLEEQPKSDQPVYHELVYDPIVGRLVDPKKGW